MKMPDVVKRIGCVDEKNCVYIEDYVYSYLNGLREKADILPIRAALFGHVILKENKRCYMIYGASCVVEELEHGRNEEQIRKEFFEDHELIGYVNITKKKQTVPEDGKGYFIFYEANEAMQNYLAFCYKREKKIRKKEVCAKDMLGQFFTLICVLILAMAVCIINDYDKMHGFIEMTEEAAYRLETEE